MWTRPESPAPRPRPASTTGGLQEALDAHDRKVGLGYGGPVISAFHAIAASPNAPQDGKARFEAIIDASGRVTSVRVLSVNGDMASWQAVAQRVLQMLRARVLRVRSVMKPINGGAMPDVTSDVDYNDTLEDVIASSGGDTSHVCRVVKDGEAVGVLDMKDLVKALVPRVASEGGVRGSMTA